MIMATLNPRINITVSPEIAAVLNTAAKKDRMSVSKMAAGLLAWAIEENEDLYFSKIADKAERSNPKWVPDSDKIWK